jgi:hypothetical protein
MSESISRTRPETNATTRKNGHAPAIENQSSPSQNAPLDHDPPRLGALPRLLHADRDRFDLPVRPTSTAGAAYVEAQSALSGMYVSNNDCRRVVNALASIPPADVPRVLAQLSDKERTALYTALKGPERKMFVDIAMRSGVVTPAVIEQPKGFGTPPSAPRLAVNANTLAPALRDVVHNENRARAFAYQQAHGDYCDRYRSDVLQGGDPVLVGDRMRRNPAAKSALPKFEPGTEKDGPHSPYRAGWRASSGPDHDYALTVAKSDAMTHGRIVRDDVITFELTGKLNVSKNVTLGGSAEFDAAGRYKESEIGVAAKTGVLETGGKLSFDKNGEAKVGFDAKLTVDGPGAIDELVPKANLEFANDGSVKFKTEFNVESDDPQVAAKTDRQKARADRGHDFSGLGVSVSSEHGGTVGLNVSGAQLEISADGHAAVGFSREIGPVELGVMMHMDTSKASMRAQLEHVGGIRADEIPVEVLEKTTWDELPPKFRAELEHQLWNADLWHAHRTELAAKKETAQRLLLVQR